MVNIINFKGILLTMALSVFAGNIKYLRNKNGWSQEQLAKKVYCCRSLIGRIELDLSPPSIALADRISDEFKLDLHTIRTITLQ